MPYLYSMGMTTKAIFLSRHHSLEDLVLSAMMYMDPPLPIQLFA